MAKSVEDQIVSVQQQIKRLQIRLKSLRGSLRLQKSYFRTREVASILGVCSETVIRMIECGTLKGRRKQPRGKWFITRRSLETLAASVGQRLTQEPPTPS